MRRQRPSAYPRMHCVQKIILKKRSKKIRMRCETTVNAREIFDNRSNEEEEDYYSLTMTMYAIICERKIHDLSFINSLSEQQDVFESKFPILIVLYLKKIIEV